MFEKILCKLNKGILVKKISSKNGFRKKLLVKVNFKELRIEMEKKEGGRKFEVDKFEDKSSHKVTRVRGQLEIK